MKIQKKQKSKLITKEQIKELYNLVEYEDDEIQELVRKLIESYNKVYVTLKEKIADEKRKKCIENEYVKLKKEYEKLSKKNEKEIKNSVSLYEKYMSVKLQLEKLRTKEEEELCQNKKES